MSLDHSRASAALRLVGPPPGLTPPRLGGVGVGLRACVARASGGHGGKVVRARWGSMGLDGARWGLLGLDWARWGLALRLNKP